MIEKSYIVFGSGLAALALLLNSCGAVKEKKGAIIQAKDSPMIRFKAGSIHAQHKENDWTTYPDVKKCANCLVSNTGASNSNYQIVTLARFDNTSSVINIKLSSAWGIWIDGTEGAGALVCSQLRFKGNGLPSCDLSGSLTTNITVVPFPQPSAGWTINNTPDPDDDNSSAYTYNRVFQLCQKCEDVTVHSVTIMQKDQPDQIYVCNAETPSSQERNCRIRIHSVPDTSS